MKKVVSVVLAVMMLASLSVFAFADVNPSVTTKAAPEFDADSVVVDGVDGNVSVELTAAATELDENATEEEKAEFEEKKEAVNNAIEAVTEQADLVAAVEQAVVVETTSTIATDVYDTAEDAVPAVSDVFYFDAKDENGESVLATEYVEGETPAVKVLVKVVLPDNLMKVLQFVKGVWVEVPVVLDENGEACLEVSYVGPIVFVVNSNVEKG